jgi:hypothetical protein
MKEASQARREIVAKLRQVDVLTAQGKSIAEGVSARPTCCPLVPWFEDATAWPIVVNWLNVCANQGGNYGRPKGF